MYVALMLTLPYYGGVDFCKINEKFTTSHIKIKDMREVKIKVTMGVSFTLALPKVNMYEVVSFKE